MATRKKNASSSQVSAAWQKVRRSLKQAEAAMRAVVDANAGLLRAVSSAGVSMTESARSELNARVKKLDSSRKNAKKQLNDLAQRLMTLGRKPAPKMKARRR